MKGNTQRRLRDVHRWLGVFFAPGILFFALSGMLQILGLHESGPGRQPAAPLIGVLASVHKDGEAVVPKRRPAPPAAGKSAGPPPRRHGDDEGFAPFKVYALMLSACLILSTAVGIAVALAARTGAIRVWIVLAAGCVVPLLLLAV